MIAAILLSMATIFCAQPGFGQADPSVVRIRFSVKQFSANPTQYSQSQVEYFLNLLNSRLQSMRCGFVFQLTEMTSLSPADLPSTLPSRHYYTGTNVSNTLQLQSWHQWWLDSDPNQNGDQPPANFNAARTSGGTVESISSFHEMIDLWTTAVINNKTTFKYKQNACNLYLIWAGYGGGFGNFPGSEPDGDNIMVISGLSSSLFLHEWGHWTGLFHTFASAEGTKDLLGDDDIADTPVDVWDVTPYPNPPQLSGPHYEFFDGISFRLYGQSWAALLTPTPENQRNEVRAMAGIARLKFFNTSDPVAPLTYLQLNDIETTWVNIMSYHKHAPTLGQLEFTPLQLDKITDNISFLDPLQGRANAVSGLFHFVGSSGNPAERLGSSKNPYPTVQQAVEAADPIGDDILLLRAGTRHFSGTISKPLTLRARKNFPATITAP